MIQLKNPDVFRGLVKYPLHQKLIELVAWAATQGPSITITCAYEKRNYFSVHSMNPLRGIDIRSWSLIDPEKLVAAINAVWIYDPGRPEKKCALYHDAGHGPHIHLQVHPRTIYQPKPINTGE